MTRIPEKRSKLFVDEYKGSSFNVPHQIGGKTKLPQEAMKVEDGVAVRDNGHLRGGKSLKIPKRIRLSEYMELSQNLESISPETFNSRKKVNSKSIHFTGLKPSMYSSRDFLDS